MSKLYDVIIAGAGPIGLFLASELGLARLSVLVLEKETMAESPWKTEPLGMRGVNTQALEAFYRRGLLGKLVDPEQRPQSIQKKPGFQFGGHFGGIMLNANKLDLDRWKYRLPGPALVPAPSNLLHIENILYDHAESLGVTIRRGQGVTKITAQDDHSVTVEAGENQSFSGRYLVGCDGGRSVVRKATGFTFAGTEAKFTGYAVHCDFDHPEKLKHGFYPTKAGMYIVGGPNLLYLVDFDGGAFDRNQEVKQEHVQEIFEHVSGIEGVKITKIHNTLTFTDRSKQATSYRKDRILLAGDAAHIHGPLGSQGLNLGMADAMNLGWKLASTVRQESLIDATSIDLSLLDTYERERHPVGLETLHWIRAQVAMLQPDPHGAAVQSLIREMIDTTDGANMFMGRFMGLSQRYNLGEGEAYAHPLVGTSAPDFELLDGSRLGSKLEGGHGLLVDFEDDTVLKDLVEGGEFKARVRYLSTGAKNTCGVRALLVRPDGVVAWVVEEDAKPDVAAASEALGRWFAF